VLKKQVRGSSYLEYGLRDVYNKLAQFEYRRFDGGMQTHLLKYLIGVSSMGMISTLHLKLM